MKKFTFLFLALVITLGISAQELPLDFEVPEDDNWSTFNGATAMVVVDPTNASNQVLELTSNGADFDGASINMGTYIDLSDDNNNTITLEFWTPDATPRTHLLKLEGASSSPTVTELYFSTTAAGWQTVTIDFGAGLSNDYPILVLFADSGSGNTATGTYYIDDIDGPNGAIIPPDPVPSGPANVPNAPDSEVYSIYNDNPGFSTNFPVAYTFGTLSGEPDLDPSVTENKALKFNFGVAGWGQGEGGPDDVSSYSFVSFDYWAGPTVVGFDFVLISNNGGITEHKYQISIQEPVVNEAWTKVQIPMSYFTNIGFADTALWQWKFSPLNDSVDNSGIVYVDNILLTQNLLSINEFETASFSVYPNPTNDVWNIEGISVMIKVALYDILGKEVLTITPNTTAVTIDTTTFKTGIYFAKIEGVNGTETVKLVRQ
ncbi:T9SS type A sorting domain-containing protein [Winogradskyella vincentii]|uniref:T9SS type A sorting domain-containing protein n=1 Tax=Winogradskyella vincentii TaxID=2877122 RepID=A0ABS7Y688_9FLAO|nr:T9SS type A sorting domain-containing protein [Winogradskyella vincentii]MCA0154142.1 T9SS type A sorting domain-containing protein [Winogradskyella vincentii]